MLVAAELLRHDAQTIMIAETGGNISTKEKYDILTKEAMDLLKGKGDLVYLLEFDLKLLLFSLGKLLTCKVTNSENKLWFLI